MNIPNRYDASLPFGGWIQLIHEWTKHYPNHTEGVRPYSSLHDEDGWMRLMNGLPILLPSDEAHITTQSHKHIIQNRQSIRAYQSDALSWADLGRVLRMVYPRVISPVRGGYASAFIPDGQIELSKLGVLVNHVEGIPHGAYLYDETAHGLYTLRTDHPYEFLETICTQREFLQSPVILVVGGSLNNALARYGERGYRYLLMEIGAILAKLYVIMGAMGLGGSISGSFMFRDLERWLGYDGIHQTIAATFVFGRPPITEMSE